MRLSVKIFSAIGIAAVATLLGFWAGWLHRIDPPAPPPTDAETTPAPDTDAMAALHARQPPGDPNAPRPVNPTVDPTDPTARLSPPTMATAPADAQTLDDIITASNDNTQKVAQILALLPRLPEADQPEAAQHAVNLTPDEGYGTLATLLTNVTTSEPVLEVLLTDLLNRRESLKLPALLQIAQLPNHPNGTEAKDILEVYLEQDFGSDWNAWGQALEKWLKENPDPTQ